MSARNWTPAAGGSVADTPTDDYPNLVTLTSHGAGYEQFDASASPPRTTFSLVSAGRSSFALYIETETSVGRRQFKFETGTPTAELRFGWRYQVGIGEDARDGATHLTEIDLNAIATSVEPGVTISAITATFVRVGGAVQVEILDGDVVVVPPPPPAGTISRADASRFLLQSTFGPTEAAIDELVALGSYDAWIDRQFGLTPSLTLPFTKANGTGSNHPPRHWVWWENALHGEDQLRQRVAFALSELFVVADGDYHLARSQHGMSSYYDMLITEGLGSFRELLEHVTLHPVMGIYLSMLRNEKADPSRNVRPDENYAREVLQLFTIGLVELNTDGRPRLRNGEPIPTYDQTIVEEFAKVFTGWNLAGTDRWSSSLTSHDKEEPMVPVEQYHDTSAKHLLNGEVIPAGGTTRSDLEAALDNIVAHPNTPTFVSVSLIKRLVSSNPSADYVRRVSAAFSNDGNGNRGNMEAVVRAILTDADARPAQLDRAEVGKVKEPILRMTQVWRALNVVPAAVDGTYRPYARAIYVIEGLIGQSPMSSPSVFNFFLPDNPLRPGSDLVAPEVQILGEVDLALTNNMFFHTVFVQNNYRRSTNYGSTINIDRQVGLAGDAAALVEHLHVLLGGGTLPDAFVDSIIARLEAEFPMPADAEDAEEMRVARAADAIFCIVGSPFHLVQK